MTTEVERKFIVANLPSAVQLGRGESIRQGYLAEEGDVEVRVRITDYGATLTVKGGNGLSRTEVECVLTDEQAEELWPHTEGRRISKVRYRVAADRLVAEVDVYQAELAGLQTVEVEFESVERARRFATPAWFGAELTGVRGWNNAALARHGRPPA